MKEQVVPSENYVRVRKLRICETQGRLKVIMIFSQIMWNHGVQTYANGV